MTDTARDSRYPWRSPAIWLAIIIAAMMMFNSWQAFSNPAAFAIRFGLPGAADAHSGFVFVYASRALFLALVTAALMLRREFAALGWFALVAVVMPIADATQVSAAGGPSTIVIRHVAIAGYLVLTGWLLVRLARQQARQEG